MIEISDKRNCIGCGNCVNVCPISCIKMETDREGFMYPIIQKESCINCKKCELVCPINEKSEIKEPNPIKIIGANNKNEDIRFNSSSGGVFGEIAIYCLKNGGIVWGAAWNSLNEVEHIYITDIKELWKLQKSKYVQSNITKVFPILKQQLLKHPILLFSGTPCQVKALYNYLGHKPHNLVTIEVVCHGAPSPLILKKYLAETSCKFIDFRNKKESWSDYSIQLTTKDEKIVIEKARQNLYMKGFLKDIFLRPSCEKCPAKSFNSKSDYTLGDFWGVKNIIPELYDDKGTSIIFIHTELGVDIWNKIKENFKYKETSFNKAIEHNQCIVKSVKFHHKRKAFFKSNESIISLLYKYTNENSSFCNILYLVFTIYNYLKIRIVRKNRLL